MRGAVDGRRVGMLAGAGLAGAWHHSRAHRFFTSAHWHPATVGLTVLRLTVGHLVPVGAPLVVAIDDTILRRCGRRVHAAHWGYDESQCDPGGLMRSNASLWHVHRDLDHPPPAA